MPARSRNKARVPLINPDSRQHLRTDARSLPERPGVYLMRDSGGAVIYVGKAVNLRRRVTSYATDSGMSDRKVSKLVSQYHSLSYIPTASELEALLVESRLIKAYHPVFNRQLIEPESCCYLRADLEAEYPYIEVVYSRTDNDGEYLGPFWKSALVHKALEGAADIFGLRRCSGSLPVGGKRTCLYYEFRKCAGPCIGAVSAEEYRRLTNNAWACLSGESSLALESLRSRMEEHVEGLRFEKARSIHFQIRALEHVSSTSRAHGVGQSDFGLVVQSYLEARPVLLLFQEGRLIWKALAGPRRYPDETIIADRIASSAGSEMDMLPGRPSVDDLLIIQSYLHQRRSSSRLQPILPHHSPSEAGRSLAEALHAVRKAT